MQLNTILNLASQHLVLLSIERERERERERHTARDVQKILVKTHEGIKPCERPMREWTDNGKEIALKIYTVCSANSCEHCFQTSVCIKDWDFPDQSED